MIPDKFFILWGAVFFIMALVIAFAEQEPNPCATYNEMRQIHIDSAGEFGWPIGAIRGVRNEQR